MLFNFSIRMLKILAIAAHPDDIELSCSGTLIKHAKRGDEVRILDLTESELSTRGSVAMRTNEANDAANVMGAVSRDNAKMADGFFKNDEEHQRVLIAFIRHYKPDVVIANALQDRHPDHGRAGRLIADSCFLSGLRKIETYWKGERQHAWRPAKVYHMMQDRLLEPTFIVDITDSFEQKMESIRCYKSQFFGSDSNEPITYIATADFLDNIGARDRTMGKRIGVKYAEAFFSENIPGVAFLNDLILPDLP